MLKCFKYDCQVVSSFELKFIKKFPKILQKPESAKDQRVAIQVEIYFSKGQLWLFINEVSWQILSNLNFES